MNLFFYHLINVTNSNLFLKNHVSNDVNHIYYLFYYKKNYNLFHSKELLLLSQIDNPFLLNYMNYLKNNLNTQSKLLSDLCGSDFLGRKKRFNVTYNISSLLYHTRYLINIWNNELDFVRSITQIFPAAQWYERETWDLFGIGFKGNKDLRRILTDYGFYGHPLRKDFPLTGYVELGYDLRMNSIVYKNVTLIQEFREFDTLSPWDFFMSQVPNSNR
jgi:NADH-quinone oxidoreductase subunit C